MKTSDAIDGTQTVLGVCGSPGTGRVQVECDRHRALVVDDEGSIRTLFRALLLSELPQLKIDTAANGLDAVRTFTVGHQAVLIMDIHMPVMNGRDAFYEIQKVCAERQWNMPSVIFCTGYAPGDTLDPVLRSDPRHCLLLKPVSGDTIVDAVRRRLN